MIGPDGVARVYRQEYGRYVATLVRVLGDIDLAEEAVQEAFTIAVERWPAAGLPPNPGAWITTTARNRAVDRLRREAAREDNYAQAALLHQPSEPQEVAEGQAIVRACLRRKPARAVPDPGRDRGRALGRADRRGHRLVPDPGPVRPAHRHRADPRGRAEPGRRHPVRPVARGEVARQVLLVGAEHAHAEVAGAQDGLGPLEPRLKELLYTPSGRVELTPPVMESDLDRLRAKLAQPVPEVVLIGRRQLRSSNSWLHNVPSLLGGSNRCTLHINPADVERYDLGEQAAVRSAKRELVAEVEPTDEIMPGVVSLPHGWGTPAADSGSRPSTRRSTRTR